MRRTARATRPRGRGTPDRRMHLGARCSLSTPSRARNSSPPAISTPRRWAMAAMMTSVRLSASSASFFGRSQNQHRQLLPSRLRGACARARSQRPATAGMKADQKHREAPRGDRMDGTHQVLPPAGTQHGDTPRRTGIEIRTLPRLACLVSRDRPRRRRSCSRQDVELGGPEPRRRRSSDRRTIRGWSRRIGCKCSVVREWFRGTAGLGGS